MARGFESKSVEEQQAETAQRAERHEERKSDAAAASVKAAGQVAEAEVTRRRQSLEMQRERILSERTASPHRRSALAAALATIEEELTTLGWTVHL